MAPPQYRIYSSGIKKSDGYELAIAIKGGAGNIRRLLSDENNVLSSGFGTYYETLKGKKLQSLPDPIGKLLPGVSSQNLLLIRDIADSIGINQIPIYEYTNGEWQLSGRNIPADTEVTIDSASKNKFSTAQKEYLDKDLRKEMTRDPAITAERQFKLDPTKDADEIRPVDAQRAEANVRNFGDLSTAEGIAQAKTIATQKADVQADILKFLEETYADTKGLTFDRAGMGMVPKPTTAGVRFRPDSEASLEQAKQMFPESFPAGMTLAQAQAQADEAIRPTTKIGEDTYTFTFDWNPETLGIDRLDLFKNGQEWKSINNPDQMINFNNQLTNFSLNEARTAQQAKDTLPVPTKDTGTTSTTATGGAFGGATQAGGGIGSFPLGANLTAGGIPMPGTLQQQALSRVPLSTYRQALPQAMPGGGIPLMRGLYKSPLELAQEAYLLSSRMGTFQPQGSIPDGTGAFGFQQYLGGQPDYVGDLQAGLGAIQQVKQKIINGVNPDLLSDAEKQIYVNYIGGSESNPYAGSANELALRQRLTKMLPAPLRGAASQNLQNIYNQALATRPSTVGGMPQSLMYGGATGTGSPFSKMSPMNVNVNTGTSPYGQPSQQPTRAVNATGSQNMNNRLTTNSTVDETRIATDNNQSIIFKRDPVSGKMTTGMQDNKNVGVNIKVPGQGTRVELMTETEADKYYTNLLNSGQLDVLTKQQILASGRYPNTAKANEYIMKYGMSKEQETKRRITGASAQAAAAAKAKQDIMIANQKAKAASIAQIGSDEYKRLMLPGGIPPAMPGMPGSNSLNTTTMTLGGKKIQPVPYDQTQLIPNPWDRRFNNMEKF